MSRVCKALHTLCPLLGFKAALFGLACYDNDGTCWVGRECYRLLPPKDVLETRLKSVLQRFPETRVSFYQKEGRFQFMEARRPEFEECRLCKCKSVAVVARERLMLEVPHSTLGKAFVGYHQEDAEGLYFRLGFVNDYVGPEHQPLPATGKEARELYKYHPQSWKKEPWLDKQCLLCCFCDKCFSATRAYFCV